MKKVLLISRGYYPSDLPSAHRVAKFAKYLPEFGWEPAVICANWNRTNSMGCFDPELMDKDTFKVVRIPYITHDDRSISGLIDRFSRKILPVFYPFQLFRDMRRSAVELTTLIQFDAIIATSPPYITLNIADCIHQKKGIPWIADFRDLADEFADGNKWIKRLHVKQEKILCASSIAMTTVSQPLADILSTRYESPVHVVYNGFDPDDFTSLKVDDNEYFTIVYCGLIYSDRTPSLLFDALDLILDQGKSDLSRLRVRFYGVHHDELSRYFKGKSCKRLIQTMGRVPFHAIVEIERKASVLLLLTHSNSKGIMTSKIFEYLAAGKPILSVPGDGDVTDKLIQETKAGIVCGSSDRLADIILNWYREWETTGYVHYSGLSDKINFYTRKNQTRSMAQLLDTILSRVGEHEKRR